MTDKTEDLAENTEGPIKIADNPNTIDETDPADEGYPDVGGPRDVGGSGSGPAQPRTLIIPPEVEDAFRKIAKEEIGKALGHTIV